MKWVAFNADSLKMMPLLEIMPTRWPQIRAKPHTIEPAQSAPYSKKSASSAITRTTSRMSYGRLAEAGMRS